MSLNTLLNVNFKVPLEAFLYCFVLEYAHKVTPQDSVPFTGPVVGGVSDLVQRQGYKEPADDDTTDSDTPDTPHTTHATILLGGTMRMRGKKRVGPVTPSSSCCPTTSVPADYLYPEPLSPVRCDSIHRPKRVRDSSYSTDVEVDPRETCLRDDIIVRGNEEPHLEQDSWISDSGRDCECNAYADALRGYSELLGWSVGLIASEEVQTQRRDIRIVGVVSAEDVTPDLSVMLMRGFEELKARTEEMEMEETEEIEMEETEKTEMEEMDTGMETMA
ncbi:hypothetical protein Tco_0667503 [Tanacetum coccineum]